MQSVKNLILMVCPWCVYSAAVIYHMCCMQYSVYVQSDCTITWWSHVNICQYANQLHEHVHVHSTHQCHLVVTKILERKDSVLPYWSVAVGSTTAQPVSIITQPTLIATNRVKMC